MAKMLEKACGIGNPGNSWAPKKDRNRRQDDKDKGPRASFSSHTSPNTLREIIMQEWASTNKEGLICKISTQTFKLVR